MNKRLLLPWAVVCGALSAAALPLTQAIKAFSAGKAGEIHGVIDYPVDSGTQGLEIYLPGRIFRAVLPPSGEFTLNYVPPGSHTLVVATRAGQVLHTEPGVLVASRDVTEVGTLSVVVDLDGDGYDSTVDCDDMHAGVHPGAQELPDGLDNDCDGEVDEWMDEYNDADNDGYPAQAGWGVPVDCDDSDPTRYPTATEVCDGVDNDCDYEVDEGFDVDGDTFTTCNGDCNDGDLTIYPGAPELVDGLDNDCDGLIDEDFDLDFDFITEANGDCEPYNGSVYTGAIDWADGLDNDCDGTVDEGAGGPVVLFADPEVVPGDADPPEFYSIVIDASYGVDSVERVIMTPHGDPNRENGLGGWGAPLKDVLIVPEGIRVEVWPPAYGHGGDGALFGGAYWFFVVASDGTTGGMPGDLPHLTVN